MKIFLTFLLTLSLDVYATSSNVACPGIVPINTLKIPLDTSNLTGISRKDFFSLINSVQNEYSRVISSMGDRLVMKKRWLSSTVNAFAEKKGHRRIIEMHGGFARHPLVTKDSFLMVVCHEMGHHVGGIPYGPMSRERWASNEGQSDYFAGMKCMRKILMNQDNQLIMSKVFVPEIVSNKCSFVFNQANEKALCERIAMAGYSLASIFRSLRNSKEISFSTPDPKIQWRTWFLHPIPQCRLDTYFESAACPIDHNINVSYEDETVGVCARVNNQEIGARPLCWFAPQE